jgi:hypothetical protein
MNTNTTLQNAVFNFAFTGVMSPHRRAEDVRPQSLMSRLVPTRK